MMDISSSSPDEPPRIQPASQPCGPAPISSLFKECVALIDQLVLCSAAQILVNFDYLDLQASKLRTWGNDTGAFTWELDRTLRKASRLQQHVLVLLTCFRNGLQRGEFSWPVPPFHVLDLLLSTLLL